MPTAVLDLDISRLPSEVSCLESYNKAFVLIRYKGIPVGKATVPVSEGRLIPSTYLPHFRKVSERALQKSMASRAVGLE